VKKETVVWLLLFLVGGTFLAYRASTHGMALVYVRPIDGRIVTVPPRERLTAGAAVSIPRTFGIWLAAFLTVCVFSFLYRDNPFYKLAEALLVGISAAYWMVISLWTVIVPNLLGKIAPDFISRTAMPGTIANPEWVYWIPLILGIMLLCRLLPKGAWLSRWPLALIIGTTAGMRMIGYLEADFVSQIDNTILPLAVWSTNEANGRAFDFWQSLKNITIVIGVIAGLVYFFFSVEHKGVVGKISRLGIWFLMITFGAAFAYTVMGRITLLAQRMEFLFDDWLWLIDPTGSRLGM
jgi:hypothetical protein